MRTPDELLAIADDALKAARAAGAEAAEAYVTQSRETAMNVVGTYAVPKEGMDDGIGLRVVVGGRLGLSGASGVSPRVVRDVARLAVDAARRVPETGAFKSFRGPAPLRAPASLHPALVDPDPARLASVVDTALERLARASDVTYSGVTVQSMRSTFAVASTEGVRAWEQAARERFTVEARVTRGTTERTSQDGANARAPIDDARDLGALVDSTIERARSAFDARPLARPADEVILTPLPAAQVVPLFAPALSAKRVRERQSPLAGRALGDEVASPLLTLLDSPEGPAGVQHLRCDHEGTPAANRALVQRGRLASLLYDSTTALAEGREPTGNGLRGNVTGGVGIRPVNLEMAPGDASLDDIIASTTRAVLVNESLMGSFVANEVTGDLSLVAPFAFLVEDGRIRHALPPTTVAGNVHKALAALRQVGRDRRDMVTGTYPAVRMGGVSCAT